MITFCNDCDQREDEECGDDGHEVYDDSYCGSCTVADCKKCTLEICPVHEGRVKFIQHLINWIEKKNNPVCWLNKRVVVK